jgi:hypothetical protein
LPEVFAVALIVTALELPVKVGWLTSPLGVYEVEAESL